MLNIRFSSVRAFALPLVVASLVLGSGTVFASSLIGSRTTSITLDISANKTAYIVGLTQSEASSVTGSNYLTTIKPYDAEKTGKGDTLHCWAATSANMLAYTGWGNVNGFRTEDDIFAYFTSNFTDDGSNTGYGNQWFMTGRYNAPMNWAQLTTTGSGGFWPNESIDYGYKSVYSDGVSGLQSLLGYLQKGYAVGLSIGWYGSVGRDGGHAVTAWGVTYDSAGNFLSLLISDSDNNYGRGVNAPDTLNELFLVYNAAGYYTFSNSGWGTGRLDGFNYLAAMPVPEPPAFMLFGLGLIGMILMRRKMA